MPQTFQLPAKRIDYFDDFSSFLEHVKLDKLPPGAYQRRHGFRETSWAGGLDYNQAVAQALTGVTLTPNWLALRDKLLTHCRPAIDTDSHWDVEGSSMIDVGTFLSGQPECVLNYREDLSRSRRVVSLIYNICVSAAVSADILRLRGLAFLALVDALEMSKLYRLNVYVAAGNAGKSFNWGGTYANDHELVVRVKDSSHPYDPQAMGFAIGHPSFFRRLVFGFWDTLPPAYAQANRLTGDACYGYPGTVRDLHPEIDPAPSISNECGLYGDAANTDSIMNEQSAQAWIADQLLRFGVEVHAGNE